jgi:NADH-quinone oxidoreductase subunit B
MFNNYAIVQGVDQVVPVDVYAPGCPPNPQTLLHSILTLHEQVRTGELVARRQGTGAGAGIQVDEQTGGDQRVTLVRPPVHVGTPR